jgi:DeoR family suf operon transcriptional repressor
MVAVVQPASQPATLGPGLASLPPTRRSILVTLRKTGEARAEDLAAALGITVSAVRQHLNGLAANGFVTFRVAKGGPGRPRHLYRLAPAAEALFPKAYGELTNELLSYVDDENPEMLDRVFERRRQRRVDGALRRLDGKEFADRVVELARILDEDGYLADFEQVDDDTFRITEHNCAILDVAQRYGRACSSEIEFLRDSLPDASVERVAHMMAGAHVCAYEVRRQRRRPRARRRT